MKRRIFAALALLSFAAGSTLYWNGGSFDPVTGAINLAAALAGLALLQYRWKRRDARRIGPDKARDIFS